MSDRLFPRIIIIINVPRPPKTTRTCAVYIARAARFTTHGSVGRGWSYARDCPSDYIGSVEHQRVEVCSLQQLWAALVDHLTTNTIHALCVEHAPRPALVCVCGRPTTQAATSRARCSLCRQHQNGQRSLTCCCALLLDDKDDGTRGGDTRAN